MRSLTWVILLLASFVAVADSWSFQPELKTTEFTFGATRIVRMVDAREDQFYPDFRIDVFTNDELVGRYGGQYFEHIAADERNSVFVGVSNFGIPNTAIIIFDAEGRLRALANHDLHADRFDYCGRSVTLAREWYDRENASIRFQQSAGGSTLEARSCRGEVLNLLEMLR